MNNILNHHALIVFANGGGGGLPPPPPNPCAFFKRACFKAFLNLFYTHQAIVEFESGGAAIIVFANGEGGGAAPPPNPPLVKLCKPESFFNP